MLLQRVEEEDRWEINNASLSLSLSISMVRRKKTPSQPNPSETPEQKADENFHLQRSDYRIIVTWMENNFSLVHGTTQKTTIDGKKPSKISAFKSLAEHLAKTSTTKGLKGVTQWPLSQV